MFTYEMLLSTDYKWLIFISIGNNKTCIQSTNIVYSNFSTLYNIIPYIIIILRNTPSDVMLRIIQIHCRNEVMRTINLTSV